MYELKTQEDEIREAITAGRRAYEALSEAERHLSSAKGWGLWDTLGGGFISGMIKHSKMDDAQRCVERAQRELDRFRYELRDVESCADLNVNADSFVKIIDLFADGFLVDLFVQSQIGRAIKEVSRAREEVKRTVAQLERMIH